MASSRGCNTPPPWCKRRARSQGADQASMTVFRRPRRARGCRNGSAGALFLRGFGLHLARPLDEALLAGAGLGEGGQLEVPLEVGLDPEGQGGCDQVDGGVLVDRRLGLAVRRERLVPLLAEADVVVA